LFRKSEIFYGVAVLGLQAAKEIAGLIITNASARLAIRTLAMLIIPTIFIVQTPCPILMIFL
jgi:high-affinity nickel permease